MAQEIYLIDNGNELKNKLIQLFEKEKEYKFKKAKTTEIETVLKNIPALIIINEDEIDEDIIHLCNHIRENEESPETSTFSGAIINILLATLCIEPLRE